MIEQSKGNCPHGEFILIDGCPQCKAAVWGDRESRQIVKVRFGDDATEGREYVYYFEGVLVVGDVVDAPTKNSTQKATVTAINVPEAEVASFKDAMKTISAIPKQEEQIPLEITSELSSEQEEMEEGLNSEGLTLIDASEPKQFTGLLTIKPQSETAVVRIKPLTYQNIQAIMTGIKDLVENATAFVIDSEATVETATVTLSSIATLKRAATTGRKDFLEPLQDFIADVKADFKLLMDPIEEADRILRSKVVAYRVAQQRKKAEADAITLQEREIAERKAALNNEQAPTQPVVLRAEPKTYAQTSTGSSALMGIAKWRVVDLSLVDRNYLMIDAGKVGKDVKSSKGTISIPGIEIWIEPTLQVKGRKD